MNELLELKGITAGYEHTVVLRDVNLSIREHDFIGIIGPNGRENNFIEGDFGIAETFLW